MTQLSFQDWQERRGDAAADAPAARRVFLGWDRPALASAAEWLLEHGPDLGGWVVALPGTRAVRRLRERLARGAPPDWTPPRVLTQGELTDLLLDLERPAAGRLVRTLAWESVLRELGRADAQRLFPDAQGRGGSPAGEDEALRLAETVRRLHGELAPEGADFRALAEGPARPELESEAARWEALAHAQDAYRAALRRAGLADPHEERLRAIRAGRVERAWRICLVGVADMNRLLARLLREVAERVTALVVAPEQEAAGFDELGRLRTALWREREVPLPLERWHVREKPVDQAEAVSELLAGWAGRFAAHEITIGIADEEVVPYLQRRLARAGARGRHAAGVPLARTRPFRLLRTVARYLAHGRFTELAALARDPDLGPLLADGGTAPRLLDRYHQKHLPRSGRGAWVEGDDLERTVRTVHARLESSLGALAKGERRPHARWAAPVRRFLTRVYSRPLDPELEADHALGEALRRLGAALGELEQVPPELSGGGVDAASALELVLSVVRAERVPPPPPPPGEAVVELEGWLDLVLDDAPALVVTGFEEGRVPQSVGAHAFLPDGARRRLGLPGDEERLARDAYAACVLLADGRETHVVTGRRSVDGDPLVPSRLAFRRPDEEIVARVQHFLGDEEERHPPAADEGEGPRFACPLGPEREPPTRMSVTSFRAWLSSPYLFYLERVLKLKTLDDRTAELDPLRFGILAHHVLEDFGRGELRDSADPRAIEAFLHEALEARLLAAYGEDPLPAVRVQAEQLRYRLGAFAAAQAARRGEGWRVHAVEWEVPEGTALEVDGEPMVLTGKVDRVDVHDDGRWAILDYKTGEGGKDPERAHRRRGGEWIDLQLPLYRYLGRLSLGLPGEPELGFVTLGKSRREIAFRSAAWSVQELEHALEEARRVVREVRAGRFDEPGKPPWDELTRALWGEGLLGAREEVAP